MRKRKISADNKLPPRVYKKGKKYRWHPKEGGSIALCDIDSPLSLVWKCYEERQVVAKYTFAHLVDEYFASDEFKMKKAVTQENNRRTTVQPLRIFGKVSPNQIKPQDIRRYMDKRGEDRKPMANQELALMNIVFKWGFERGKVNGVPSAHIKRFKVGKRDRYITHEEYSAVYSMMPPHIKVMMEISYLCAARIKDVCELKYSDITEGGIYIRQSKTGKKQIKEWSPRLHAAIELSRTLTPDSTGYVVRSQKCKRFKPESASSIFSVRTKEIALEIGVKKDFTFHDIKAKGISDYEGTQADKQYFSGHKSIGQMEEYNVTPDVVPALNPNWNPNDY